MLAMAVAGSRFDRRRRMVVAPAPRGCAVMLKMGDFAVGRVGQEGGRDVSASRTISSERPSVSDRRFKRVVPSGEMVEMAEEALAPILHTDEWVAAMPLPAARLLRTPGFIRRRRERHPRCVCERRLHAAEDSSPKSVASAAARLRILELCQLMRSMRQSPEGAIVVQAVPALSLRAASACRAPRCATCSTLPARPVGSRRSDEVGDAFSISPQFADLCERGWPMSSCAFAERKREN